MEEQPTTQSQSSIGKFVIPAVVVVVIAAAVFAFYTAQGTKQTGSTQTAQQVQETKAPEATAVATKATSKYKDGKYNVTGSYVSPGGPREVGVVITLKDGVITDSVFEGKAEDPTSIKFQGEFAQNYQPLVVGKNIDEVSLTKVAGSSLTPKGFDDALEKVKAEAKNS
jgi:uncharacterized protein with FMN-binding domain